MSIVLFLLLAAVRATSLAELTDKITHIQNTPLVVLTLVYDSDKSNPLVISGGNLEVYLEQIRKSKEGYFDVVAIDCAQLEPEAISNFLYCTESHRPKLPLLVSPP